MFCCCAAEPANLTEVKYGGTEENWRASGAGVGLGNRVSLVRVEANLTCQKRSGLMAFFNQRLGTSAEQERLRDAAANGGFVKAAPAMSSDFVPAPWRGMCAGEGPSGHELRQVFMGLIVEMSRGHVQLGRSCCAEDVFEVVLKDGMHGIVIDVTGVAPAAAPEEYDRVLEVNGIRGSSVELAKALGTRRSAEREGG
eukprot:Skav212595  [mRNA]  locus=scaffold125:675310:677919:- [translate_table: standard]